MAKTGAKTRGYNAWPWGGAAFCLGSQALCCLAGEGGPGAAAPLSETTTLLSAIAKVFGSLVVVVGLMLILLYVIKRSGLGTAMPGSGSAIAVLETRMVAPKKYIAIIQIADKCLALGITEQAISLLTELGPEAQATLAQQARPTKTGTPFAGLLARSMKAWQGVAPGPAAPAKDHDRQESA